MRPGCGRIVGQNEAATLTQSGYFRVARDPTGTMESAKAMLCPAQIDPFKCSFVTQRDLRIYPGRAHGRNQSSG